MAAGFVLAFILLAWSSYALAEQKRNRIRMGMGKVWTAPAVIVGDARGIFQKHGVQVEWKFFSNPNQVVEGIIAKALDAGVVTTPSLVIGRHRGAKLKAVALTAGLGNPPSAFVVRADSGITRIEDLKGKKIGVNNYAGNFDLYLRYMLTKHGLNPKKDTAILEMPIPAVIKSLLAKKIDAGAIPPLFVLLSKLKFKEKIKILFSFNEIDFIQKTGRRNNMIIVMGDSFVAKNRPLAKAFIAGYLEAIKETKRDLKSTLADWSAFAGIGLIKKSPSLPYLPDDGKIDLELLKTDMGLLQQFGYVKAIPRLEDIIDHSLIDEVLAGR